MTTLNKDLAAIQISQVIEQLEDLLFCDLVMTYNDYASHNGYELIYYNDENTISEMFTDAYDAVKVTNHKEYNLNDDYFLYNGYGLMSSFSYQLIQDDNCPIDVRVLAQWLISEDKLADYDITVTTLEDMLASIEDNITDDSNMLSRLFDYLNMPLYYQYFDGSYNDKVREAMKEINGFNYEQLNKLITDLNINYQ